MTRSYSSIYLEGELLTPSVVLKISLNARSVAAVGSAWEKANGASNRCKNRNQPHRASARNTHIRRHGFVPSERIVGELI